MRTTVCCLESRSSTAAQDRRASTEAAVPEQAERKLRGLERLLLGNRGARRQGRDVEQIPAQDDLPVVVEPGNRSRTRPRRRRGRRRRQHQGLNREEDRTGQEEATQRTERVVRDQDGNAPHPLAHPPPPADDSAFGSEKRRKSIAPGGFGSTSSLENFEGLFAHRGIGCPILGTPMGLSVFPGTREWGPPGVASRLRPCQAGPPRRTERLSAYVLAPRVPAPSPACPLTPGARNPAVAATFRARRARVELTPRCAFRGRPDRENVLWIWAVGPSPGPGPPSAEDAHGLHVHRRRPLAFDRG